MDHLEKAKGLAITLIQDGDQLASLAILHAPIAIAQELRAEREDKEAEAEWQRGREIYSIK